MFASPDECDKHLSEFLTFSLTCATPDELQELVWVLAPFLHHIDTLSCPVPSHAFVWVLFLLISVLPPLCHCNHPQTSAISAHLGSFAVSVASSKPRRAARACLGP